MKLQLKKDKYGITYITTDAQDWQKHREVVKSTVRGLSDTVYPSYEDLFISQQIQTIIDNEHSNKTSR